MQKRLEDLKRVAVMNPTDANLTAYMRYQRMVMNKSEHFAERWQRLVWTVPDLDYGLSGRPTNAMAINVFDEQQRDRQAQTIKTLAATHGLIFVFRGDCPHCHRFAPILKRFEEEFGFTVLAISMDGRCHPRVPERPARQRHGRAPECHGGAGALPHRAHHPPDRPGGLRRDVDDRPGRADRRTRARRPRQRPPALRNRPWHAARPTARPDPSASA
jgi:conjugal transfer pilus assembly protein TraF